MHTGHDHNHDHHRRGQRYGHGKHAERDSERRFARGDDWLGREGRHPGRHHGRHHGRDGHPARVLEHGDLRFVILDLIAAKPRHGYEIIKAIEDKVAGAYSPSPGVVYPTLTMLEELGYTSVVEEAGRKQYTLTPAGQTFLDANRPALDAILHRMAAFGAMNADAPPPSVVRGMENLKLALRLRLSGGPLTEEQTRSLAAALDAAAIAVEQT